MRRFIVLLTAFAAAALPLAAQAQSTNAPAYEKPLSAQAVHDVQARLRALGYYGGPTDGVWGPSTRAALERFQRDRRIAVTGQLNQATVTAMGLDPNRLMARGYESRPAAPRERAATTTVGPQTTQAVQARLRRLGLYRGPVDGVWGRNTQVALEEFQRERRLPVTGTPSRETLVALGLDPDRFMAGSSTRSEADRLNRRELDHVKRSGQF